jgi:hypothetical protein
MSSDSRALLGSLVLLGERVQGRPEGGRSIPSLRRVPGGTLRFFSKRGEQRVHEEGPGWC